MVTPKLGVAFILCWKFLLYKSASTRNGSTAILWLCWTRSEYWRFCIIKLQHKMDATPSFGVTMVSILRYLMIYSTIVFDFLLWMSLLWIFLEWRYLNSLGSSSDIEWSDAKNAREVVTYSLKTMNLMHDWRLWMYLFLYDIMNAFFIYIWYY